VKTA